jgi:hypothetical protein
MLSSRARIDRGRELLAATPPIAGTQGNRMSVPHAIDVHAHILLEETISLIAKAAPMVAPKLTPIDRESAILEIAGT